MKEEYEQSQPCETSMGNFDKEFDKINTLDKMKEYLEYLIKSGINDVKRKTLVPVYDNKKKNEDSKED